MDLTIAIITKNAEQTLHRTLAAVAGFAQCVVVDDYSIDRTQAIAAAFGCPVHLHHSYDFGELRAYALALVHTKWTLVLDSDEVVTEELKAEIRKAIAIDAYTGYYIPLRNHLFGRPLHHGELHKKLILFHTKNATIQAALVHETFQVSGPVGVLKSPIAHYSYRSPMQVLAKFIDYAVRQAKEYRKKEKPYGWREIILNPIHMLFSRYVHDKGYQDGVFSRLFLDTSFALMEFLSYAYIPFVKVTKRIAVDAGSYNPHGIVQSGIDRLVQGISSSNNRENTWYLFGFHTQSTYKLPAWLFSQVWLPLATLWHRCDEFYGTAGTIPYLFRFFPLRKVLFLHDFGFYHHPDKYHNPSRLQTQTYTSVHNADVIIVFSRVMYNEFVTLFPLYAHKAHVVPAGADHLISLDEKPLFIREQKPLYLYVGVVKPIKRIELLLEAVGDAYLVLAGPQEQDYVRKLPVAKMQNVQTIQNFNDGQLKWLYTHANALLYASQQEGFCYPVLEALMAGLPVVAFDLPLFREYQTYFPRLTLVKTVEEMKAVLDTKHRTGTPVVDKQRFTWHAFHKELAGLTQPRQLYGHKIAFICVLYRTPKHEKERLEKEICTMMLPQFKIYWIDNSTNGKGYAAGINEGIRQGLRDECTHFIALNPDISLAQVTQKDIEQTADRFDVWGFAMKQNGVVYYGGEIDKWRLSGGLVAKKPELPFQPVDFVSGSVMGFSAEVVRTIGLWDESYFMYYEDDDYCIRARRAGFRVGINTKVVYDHFEVSQMNAQKELWIARSRWKFFWKYANGIQQVREIVRLPKTLITP